MLNKRATSKDAAERSHAAKKPVFCRSLQDVNKAFGGLPSVFWDSLRLLSLKGLTTPGLFRSAQAGSRAPARARARTLTTSTSSGSSNGSIGDDSSDSASDSRVDNGGIGPGRMALLCKRLYDSGQDAFKVLPSATRDVHAVAAILKLWLHSLPHPVIPSEMYEDAMATQSGDSTQQQQLSALHQLLRKCEHQVLQLLYPLMELLHHYCLNQRHPCTERAALARSFGPVVLRPAGQSVLASADEGGLGAQCVEHMIREYRTMFVARKVAVVPPVVEAPAPSNNLCRRLFDESLPAGLHPLKVKLAGEACASTDCQLGDGGHLPGSPPRGASPDLHLQAAVSDLLFSSTSTLFWVPPSNCSQSRAVSPPSEQQSIYNLSPFSSPGSSPQSTDSACAPSLVSFGKDAAALNGQQEPQQSPTSVNCSWAAMSDDDDDGDDSSSTDDIAAPSPHTFAASQAVCTDSAPANSRSPHWSLPQVGYPKTAAGGSAHSIDQGVACSRSAEVDSLLQAPSTEILYFGPPTAATSTALMSAAEQLAAEKTAMNFQVTTGRAPQREEKEALRPLYSRYWCLKRALALAAAAPLPPSSFSSDAVAMEI